MDLLERRISGSWLIAGGLFSAGIVVGRSGSGPRRRPHVKAGFPIDKYPDFGLGLAQPPVALGRMSIRVNGCVTFIFMVTVQEAFTRAQEYARGVLGDMPYTLEEVEQDSYKGRQIWRMTLGFPKRRPTAPDLVRSLGAGLPLEYKTFLVDAETGEAIAMKLAS